MFESFCLDLDGNTLNHLMQWDLNQKIMFSDLKLQKSPVVRFHNKMLKKEEAVSVLATLDNNGNVIVDVPNFLLQKPYPIAIHICESDKDSVTTVSSSYIIVKPQNKPNDYSYVENITYVTVNVVKEEILAGIKDGSPKGAFSSEIELKSKEQGVYVNVNNGYLYYWDGSSLSDPIIQYQATGIADNSVEKSMLSQNLRNQLDGSQNKVWGLIGNCEFNIDCSSNPPVIKFNTTNSSLLWGSIKYSTLTPKERTDIMIPFSNTIYQNIIIVYNETEDDFYIKKDLSQVSDGEYVIMILRLVNGVPNHIIACEDVLNKITITTNIDGDSYTIPYINSNSTQSKLQDMQNIFDTTYRNHVLGFKSSHDFYIDTELQEVTFTPESTSVIYGNNTSAYIYKLTETVDGASVTGTYTASYAEFLSGTQTTNIIMLMYSPTLGSANNDISVRKSAFYFKPFNHSQVTDNDYVIMVLHVNTAGVAYIIACDDVLNRVYVGKGTDVSSYVPYAVDLTATTAAVERELTQARYSYYDNNTHESLAKHLYSTDTALKNHITQYRNHCRSYIGNMYLDINTDEIIMKVNIPSTGRAYGDNGFVNITKNSGSEDGAYMVNGMDVITLSDNASTILALFYSSTSKEFYIKLFGATSQPKSTNDLFMCAMRVVAIENNDGKFTIRVDEIVGCDDIVSTITVNGVKWMPGDVENHNTCSIFSRVCCIGDSATAGHIDYAYDSEGILSESVKIRRNEKFAWTAFMAKLTGNEYINLGISGATALTWLDGMSDATDDGASFNNIDKTIHVKAEWLATAYDKSGNLIKGAFETVEEKTDANGEPKKYIVYERTVENTDTISAYLIGLGMNDTLNIGTEGNLIDGGTGTPKLALCKYEDNPAADIGTGRETFYGKYSELIEKIHAVSPAAHIFVQTMHDNMNDRRVLYNEAIRYIANYYSTRENDPIPVHVLDLYKYQNLYKVDSIRNDKLGGHWTAISYQQFAEILRRIWSEYINNHASEFKDVHLIN